MQVDEATRARTEEQLAALREHEEGTHAGKDPEELHQFRVAVRRLRSLFKHAKDADPDGELRAELKWLGDLTSPVRDLDVLIERLQADAAGFDRDDKKAVGTLVAELRKERSTHRRALNRALRSRRYAHLLENLDDVAAATPVEVEQAEGEAPPPHPVRKPYRKLATAVHELDDDPPDDELHALRIHGKRLRYAAETARPAANGRVAAELKDLVKAGKAFQEILGDHQDAVVAANRVAELGRRHANPAVAFVAGRLVEREQAKRAAARDAWPDAWRRVTVAAAPLT